MKITKIFNIGVFICSFIINISYTELINETFDHMDYIGKKIRTPLKMFSFVDPIIIYKGTMAILDFIEKQLEAAEILERRKRKKNKKTYSRYFWKLGITLALYSLKGSHWRPLRSLWERTRTPTDDISEMSEQTRIYLNKLPEKKKGPFENLYKEGISIENLHNIEQKLQNINNNKDISPQIKNNQLKELEAKNDISKHIINTILSSDPELYKNLISFQTY